MDVRLLRTFVAVHDRRSVTAAALAVGCSQPTASQRLAHLERLVGGALFERSWHPLEPTDLGLAILPHARAALVFVDELLAGTADPAGTAAPGEPAGQPEAVRSTHASPPALPPGTGWRRRGGS